VGSPRKVARKRANSRPISSKTFLFPLPTASLARSKAALGFKACIADSRMPAASRREPMRNAAATTPPTASDATGDLIRRFSNVLARSSCRMVCPACFDAHVAKVHQLAVTPLIAASANESS
jgi:hypothetical protein